MDPNANLEWQRKLAEKLRRQAETWTPSQPDIDYGDVARLCDLIQVLDEWITRGGFLPKDWSPAR